MMKMPDWTKKAMGFAIASLGSWNLAIASANAQLGNILVYVAGNNPVTLNIARQVVTNPVVASVNGQTAIVAGAFDAPTADYVTRELQRRGVVAQQTYQTAQNVQPLPTPNSPYVNLPSYLPTNLSNGDNLAQYRYVTAVPMSSGGLSALAQVQRLIPQAFVSKSVRGDYIYAGGYNNRDAAESLKHFLRSQGLDARVLYF
ncbi:hypothetical protein [Pseudanabaena yagii]|uniref:SPOR domain-containing protein n=1 Tax=Pseudanabaena yagii GIHE-NHR1 TaxID=2722753 RepID=A0ABX1LLD5_9CYAN|nr:hypothetical protein [Pseudanabaena yagii]NMF56927.1 hypothetical protein [Pseudanabaena yagii GIHE-NHR1]